MCHQVALNCYLNCEALLIVMARDPQAACFREPSRAAIWTLRQESAAKPREGTVMHKVTTLVCVAATLVLSGCASGYSQFYRAADGSSPELLAQRRVAPAPKEPAVDHIGQVTDDIWTAYARHGYVAIGQSAFNSGRPEPEANAVAQARKVGADLVIIIDPRYTGSTTSSIPLTVPKTTTSYTTANATAYGAGGTVNAYGNATTTTYGTQTTYIPMTVHRSDYGAVYLVKLKYSFGARFDDLSDAQRQQLKSNHGAVLKLIVNDTPAFRADFLPGDIVVAVDDAPTYNSAEFQRQLESSAGKTINVTIVRDDQRLSKSVTLGQY